MTNCGRFRRGSVRFTYLLSSPFHSPLNIAKMKSSQNVNPLPLVKSVDASLTPGRVMSLLPSETTSGICSNKQTHIEGTVMECDEGTNHVETHDTSQTSPVHPNKGVRECSG
jgi:hypothetical protein